jgi:hypothetical protein
MADDNDSLLFRSLFFPLLDEGDDELTKSLYADSAVNRADDSVLDPVGTFIARTAADHLSKGSGWSWDEPIGAAPRVQLSKAFFERHDARVRRFAEKVRAMFPDHEEETAEMVKLVESALAAERAIIIGA